MIPLLLFLAAFMFYPIFYCMFYSGTDYAVVKDPNFVGWDNYRVVLTDPAFWTAMGKTFYVLAVCIVVELVLGMAIAMLFNREFKGQNIVRGLCLLPLLVAPLAMALIWNYILHANLGIFNQILTWIGLNKVDFFAPDTALFTIMFITIWQWTPFSIFVILAGLKSLPRDAFEAAKIDGSSGWNTFRRLTLPMLTPLILIIVLLRTMWLIRLFDPIYTTKGAVGTETLDWMVYRNTFLFFDVGRGSAMAIISLFITMIITAIMFRVLMKAMGVIK